MIIELEREGNLYVSIKVNQNKLKALTKWPSRRLNSCRLVCWVKRRDLAGSRTNNQAEKRKRAGDGEPGLDKRAGQSDAWKEIVHF